MMHDHALHELNFRWRSWRQLCRCGRRKSPAGRTRRTRLNHDRGRRRIMIMLLRTYGGAKEYRSTSQKEEKQSICPARPGTVHGGKTVEPPIQSIVQHLSFIAWVSRSTGTDIL